MKNLKQIQVAFIDGEVLLCRIETASERGAGFIVTLGAGVSRDTVARMKGATVEYEIRRRGAVAPLEMDATDWIGLDVVRVDGTRIGVIAECIESPAHDILEIEMTDGREVLLPAIEQTVESIDLESRIVTVGDLAPFVVSDAD